MISRCPSCAAQVADDATRCPACHWDFNARRRIPPDGAKDAGPVKPAPNPPPAAKAPASAPPGMKIVPFSESLGTLASKPVIKPKTETPPPARPPSGEPPGMGLHQFPKMDPRGKEKDVEAGPADQAAKGFSLPLAKTLPHEEPPINGPVAALPPKPEPKPQPTEPKPLAAEPAKTKPEKISWFSRRLSSSEAPEAKAAPAPAKAAEPAPKPAEAAPKASPAPAKPSIEPPKTVRRALFPNSNAKPPADAKARPAPDAKAKPSVDAKAKPGVAAKPAPQGRPAPPLPWPGILAAAVIAAATAIVYSNIRPDNGALTQGSRATASIFAKGAASVHIDAGRLLQGSDDSRDIRNIQRVAVDAQQAAAITLPPAAPLSAAPAPPPAPVASPPAPAPSPAPKPAAHPTVVLLSGVQAPASRDPRREDSPDGRGHVVLRSDEERARSQWVFQGRVYDLVNLTPVFDAHLRFLKPDGQLAGTASTGPDGAFSVALDAQASGGYRMVIVHNDYEFYLDEVDPPFSKMPRADRMSAATIHTSNKPWRGSTSGVTHRDVVAIPKNVPVDE